MMLKPHLPRPPYFRGAGGNWARSPLPAQRCPGQESGADTDVQSPAQTERPMDLAAAGLGCGSAGGSHTLAPPGHLRSMDPSWGPEGPGAQGRGREPRILIPRGCLPAPGHVGPQGAVTCPCPWAAGPPEAPPSVHAGGGCGEGPGRSAAHVLSWAGGEHGAAAGVSLLVFVVWF